MPIYTRAQAEKLLEKPSTWIHHVLRVGGVALQKSGGTGPGRGMRFNRRELTQLGMVKIFRDEYDLSFISIIKIWELLQKGIRQGEKWSDFWENSDYGDICELLYIESRLGSLSKVKKMNEAMVKFAMERVEKDYKLSEELVSYSFRDVGHTRIVFLGKVKKQVEVTLGLT